ncbi:MAG: electron transfer flavoprotein subunit beta/FixA family protein [Nocardioidaceae bacterium]|nr:electron transfer flavoprotein subunit beta/FixA family protein [Nocardioidaceae bacterium]
MTNVLVCIKRVPETSGQILLSQDGQSIDARHVGYTLSAHDECAVEQAIQIARSTDGEATVLTVGNDDSLEQIRNALAVGCTAAVLVEADTENFGPADVAAAIADAVRSRETDATTYDLILVGNDAADTGDFQVGVRLAYALGRPVLTGIGTVEVQDGTVVARGKGPEGTEVFELSLPAVIAVQEGGVEPRYPSIPGRMKAKRTPVDMVTASVSPVGNGRAALRLPPSQPSVVEVLGEGPAAATAVVDLLYKLGVAT